MAGVGLTSRRCKYRNPEVSVMLPGFLFTESISGENHGPGWVILTAQAS